MKFNRNKVIIILVSAIILTVFLFSGDARAFVLNLTLDKTSVDQGENVIFNASIDISQGENLPINYLVLELLGSENAYCKFDVNGNVISGCNGITIRLISFNSDYGYGYGNGRFGAGYSYFGYGYGYQYGNLKYEITLNTKDYQAGTYVTKFTAFIGNRAFAQFGQNLVIKKTTIDEKQQTDGSCLTIWSCDFWSPCVEGEQTRVCEKKRPGCYAGEEPAESRACTSNIVKPINNADENVVSLNRSAVQKQIDQISKLTGGFVGKYGKEGLIGTLVFLNLLLLLAVILAIRRNRYLRYRRRARRLK